jgi:hypothetical protein
MKTKKLLWAALALTSLLLPLSCNKNNSNEPQKEDNTPTQVMLSFIFDHTEDMLNYCNIEIILDNGEDGAQTVTVTKNLLTDKLQMKNLLTATKLPATLTIRRKITLKEDISSLKSFTYTKGHSYQHALYNAAGNQVFLSELILGKGSSSGSGQNMKDLIEAGKMDSEFIFKFKADGTLVK